MSTALDWLKTRTLRTAKTPSRHRPSQFTKRLGPAFLSAATALACPAAFGQQPAVNFRTQARPYANQPVMTAVRTTAEEIPGRGLAVMPVAHQPVDPRMAMDPRIESMPQVNQKMEVIHHRSQLVRTRARVARITFSDPNVIDIVQYSENEFSILGMQLGTTDLFLWFEGDNDPLRYAVTVVHDPSLDDQRRVDYGKIERKLQILYPNSKVYLIPLSRRVIVRGQARDPEEASRIMQTIRIEVANLEYAGRGFGDDILNYGYAGPGAPNTGANGGLFNSFVVDELQVPGEYMVQVRVRIAQLNHEMLRSYGMDLGVIFNDARNIVNTGMAATPVLSGVFDNGRVGVLLDALVQNGTGKIVEDATLVTLAGNPAAFLAGGEFAVPTTVGIGGAAASTTSFRGFGTSVIATPTIVNNDLFRLQIVTELSNINSGNAVGGIPGLNVKRVQTLVEFREGQTLVLGGMFGRTQRAEVTRIPLLGELPIVGSFLFNSKRATEDETELLIVVTPELVRAIDADQQPPMPGYYVTHPDCFDFYKYNRTEGNPNMGHYQMLPFGHGQDYAQDVGYNVFNPGPAPGGIAPQGYGPPPTQGLSPQQGYGAPPVDPGYNQSGPSYPQQGVPGGMPSGPQYGPGPGQAAPQYLPSNPQPVPQAQPTPAGPAQSMFRSSRIPVQQTSAVRGVPRNSANRGSLQR